MFFWLIFWSNNKRWTHLCSAKFCSNAHNRFVWDWIATSCVIDFIRVHLNVADAFLHDLCSNGFLGVIQWQIVHKSVKTILIQITITIDLSIEFGKLISFDFISKIPFHSLTMLFFLPKHSTMQRARLRFTVNGSSVFVREKNRWIREYFSDVFKNSYFEVRALAHNRPPCVTFCNGIEGVSMLHRCIYSIQDGLDHHTFLPMPFPDTKWTKSQISKRTPSFPLWLNFFCDQKFVF